MATKVDWAANAALIKANQGNPVYRSTVNGTTTAVPQFSNPTTGLSYPTQQSWQAAVAPSPLGTVAPTGNNLNIDSEQQKAERAAQERAAAELQGLNTNYDYLAAQAQGQLPGLENQKNLQLGQVDLGIEDVRNQVGTSKTNLGTSTQQQINQAGSTARNVQGQNRNVLRSLGILNSSAAGQILAKPGNQFDEQRAQLGQFLVQKTTELDQFVVQKVKEATQIKDSIVQNFNDLVNKIQTDLRFNERQRADAIRTANSALTQHLSEISSSVMNYKQQVDMQKQQIDAALKQVTNIQQPQANIPAITNLGLTNQGLNTTTPQMTPEELLRRKQLGLM